MSTAFRTWLPANAAAPPLAHGAIADTIDAWSAAWFTGEAVRALGQLTRLADARAELRKTAWHAHEGGIALGLPSTGAVALGAAALGVAINAALRPEADLTVLGRVGEACLEELERALAKLFGEPGASAWRVSEAAPHAGAVHRLEIGDSLRTVTLTLELSDECFARFVKARLSPAPAPRKLGASAQALAAVPVTLSALAGRCELTVAELSGLAEGDVLVLDGALDAAMPIAVSGSRVRKGTCTLTPRDDRIALTITEALAA